MNANCGDSNDANDDGNSNDDGDANDGDANDYDGNYVIRNQRKTNALEHDDELDDDECN